MYFKKLELYGFKSFVDKTSLIFEPGVTAIVGPNGTGKSNISDAIKWVLGEQSAKSMRGAKMEDVIFNGTELRPPVNMTEVSLTLSNAEKHLPIDYEEITITRRLYRSGESEYLLNKTLVRLKDINELLMGTGIGTESYSLLEQGRIDAILSSKPEERRIVFDEASGITKFKKKKDEALRKLKQTEENLLRVNDIIIEVNRQLGSIARQVNKARRYQEQFEQLKTLELQYAYKQYNTLKNERQNLQGQYNQLHQTQTQLENEITSFTSEFNNLKNILADVEAEYTQLNNSVMNITTQIEKNLHSINLNKERIEEFKQRTTNLSSDIEAATARVQTMEGQITQLKLRVDTFKEEKSAKEAQLREKQKTLTEAEVQVKEAKATIEQNKTQAVNLLSEQAQIKNELAKLSANIHNVSMRLVRLRNEQKKTSEELDNINAQLKEKTEVVGQLKQKVDADEAIQTRLNKEQTDLLAQIKNLETEIQALKQSLIANQSQLNVLEKLSKNYEGFSDTVKSFMLKKNEYPDVFSGVHDVLVNLIEVKSGYELCIETVLAQYLQAVVVDSRDVAFRLNDFLIQHGIGRVRFIALDAIVQQKDNAPSKHNLQNITDFIECDDKYKKVLAYILKDAYLLTDELNKTSSLGITEPAWCLVTKEGEICTPVELISRPSPEQKLGLISQKSQIRTLKQDCQEAEESIVKYAEAERVKQQQLKTIETELTQLTEILHEEKIGLANRDSEKASVEASQKKLDDELSVLNLEIDESTLDESDFKKEEQNSKDRLNEITQQVALNEQKMTEAQELIKVKSQQREELLVVVAEMKTEFSLLNEQEASLNENFSMLNANFMQQRSNLEDYESEKQQIAKRISELSQQAAQLEEYTGKLEQDKKQTDVKLNDVETRRSALIADFENTQNQIREKEKTLNAIKNNIRDFEVKKVELNFKTDSLISSIQQSYKVDLASLVMELDESTDWAAQKEQVDVLKNKLERMGAVNLAAVEEEEELKERANFLNSQKEDLLTAKDSLMHAIQKINRTIKNLFLDTFEKSKVAFKEYFRLLFSGGDAQLQLTEGKDVLECGIEIVVRPPGKRLQNISLLSGGEKTLTAIALLFAVFKIKPTPFCVLDEMDAPLDESNIDRFTRVLQEFLKTSQFIIITHNKKTIGIADVMYGVTMEEPGVSKLVSVKFSDYKEPPVTQEVPAPAAVH